MRNGKASSVLGFADDDGTRCVPGNVGPPDSRRRKRMSEVPGLFRGSLIASHPSHDSWA